MCKNLWPNSHSVNGLEMASDIHNNTRFIGFSFRASLVALSTLCLTFFIPNLSALPNDQEQPLKILAEHAEFDEKRGITIYEGNVTLDQGSIHIDADKLTIYSDENGISKVVAEGEQAHYQYQPSLDEELVHAYGNTIEYLAKKDMLILVKNASFSNSRNFVNSEKIFYDIARRVYTLYGDKSKGKVVTTVIQPPQKAKDDEAK